MYKYVNGERLAMSKSEIDKRLLEKALEDKIDKYREKRLQEYPSTDELVVALWEQIVEGDGSSIQSLQSRRQAVKMKYPKRS